MRIGENSLTLRDMFIGRLLEVVLFRHTIKKYAVRLLDANIIIQNPIYRYVYNQQIQHLMKNCKNIPSTVMIENTNACNYRCHFCPHQIMNRKKGVMDMELFERIVDECNMIGVQHIDIHQFGEPLLDSKFIEKVTYAKSKGIPKVTTNSNGSLLNIELSKKLVDSQLDRIYISLDAATEETYLKVRYPGNLTRVEQNIDRLIKLRNSTGSSKPEIIVNFVQQQNNRDEIKAFTKKWKDKADKVMISYMHDWAGSINEQTNEFHGKLNRSPCRLPFTDMVIGWDGRCMICCVDYDGKLIIGDLKKQNLEDVWKSKIIMNIRSSHLKSEFKEVPLCDRCTYRTTWWMSNA